MKRPWQADAFICHIVEETVTGKDSVAQKIWRSITFAGWFAEAVKGSEFPHGLTLSAAKHRFCSFSKPLGRICLHLPSLFAVVNKISAMKTTDACWATDWLEHFDMEKLLVLSMCADAADTVMQLNRFLDNEDMDIGRLNEEVGLFLDRIEAGQPQRPLDRLNSLF